MSFSQFSQLLTSRDRYYADQLNVRRSNPSCYLGVDTRNVLVDLFRNAIDNETAILKSKEELRVRINFNTNDAFNSVNKLNLVKVNSEDFRVFLRDNGVVASTEELSRLLERY